MSILGRIGGYLRGDDLVARPGPAPRPGPVAVRAVEAAGVVPNYQIDRPLWPTADVPVLTRTGYRKCVTAFAAIGIIADAVAEATLRVYRDDGAGDRPELPDHPARALIANPHPARSEAEFLALTVRIAAVAGYCLVEKVRSSSGRVVQLAHLRADWARPVPRKGAPPDWEYRVPGNDPLILKAADVIAVTYQDAPTLDFTGDTPMLAVLREAGILTSLTDLVKITLDRGGIPPYVLVVDKPGPDEDALTDAEVELTREQFSQRYAGVSNWDKPAVVQGIKVERLGTALNDLANTDLRDAVDLAVCRAFRVPALVVQVLAGIQSSYGQAFDASMRALQVYTAGPLRARLDGAFTRGLLREFDPDPAVSLEFDTSRVPALQEDTDKHWERARQAFLATGLDRNEYRQLIGFPELEGDAGAGFYDPTTPVAPVAMVPANGRGQSTDWAIRGGAKRGAETPALGGEAPKALPARTGRQLVRLPDEARAAVAAHGKAAIDRLGESGAPVLAEFWRAQAGRFVAELERAGDGPDQTRGLSDLLGIDWHDEEGRLGAVLDGLHDKAIKAATAAASVILGVAVGLLPTSPFVTAMRRRLASRASGPAETTRLDVEGIVRDGIAEGLSTAEMADRIRTQMTDGYAGRAVAAAHTESMIAFGEGSVESYRASGLVEMCEISDNPEHVADYGASDGLTCATRHGIVVELDQAMFHVSADHPNGSAVAIPVLSAAGQD